jgi:hypothetical protein
MSQPTATASSDTAGGAAAEAGAAAAAAAVGAQGSQAQYVRVPLAEGTLVKVRAALSLTALGCKSAGVICGHSSHSQAHAYVKARHGMHNVTG